jgi:hypothetical protein
MRKETVLLRIMSCASYFYECCDTALLPLALVKGEIHRVEWRKRYADSHD